MKKEINKNRRMLIDRLLYLRNKAKLSARELSLQLDCTEAYISKYENGDFNIPSERLLDAIQICNSNIEEFCWKNIENYEKERELLDLFNNLSDINKNNIILLIKNLK